MCLMIPNLNKIRTFLHASTIFVISIFRLLKLPQRKYTHITYMYICIRTYKKAHKNSYIYTYILEKIKKKEEIATKNIVLDY